MKSTLNYSLLLFFFYIDYTCFLSSNYCFRIKELRYLFTHFILLSFFFPKKKNNCTSGLKNHNNSNTIFTRRKFNSPQSLSKAMYWLIDTTVPTLLSSPTDTGSKLDGNTGELSFMSSTLTVSIRAFSKFSLSLRFETPIWWCKRYSLVLLFFWIKKHIWSNLFIKKCYILKFQIQNWSFYKKCFFILFWF